MSATAARRSGGDIRSSKEDLNIVTISPDDTSSISYLLAQDYIRWRLKEEGYDCTQERPPVPPPPPPQPLDQDILLAVRATAMEFENTHCAQLKQLLKIDGPFDSGSSSFFAVAKKLFANGVDWGHIIALYSFVGMLAIRCAERNRLMDVTENPQNRTSSQSTPMIVPHRSISNFCYDLATFTELGGVNQWVDTGDGGGWWEICRFLIEKEG